MTKKAVIVGTQAHMALAATQQVMDALAEKPARQQGKTEEQERRLFPVDHEGIPDRLSIQRGSRFYTSCGSYVGVKLDGADVNGRVIEFCRSEGWVRLVDPSLSGKPVSDLAASNATRHNGVVETHWRMTPSRQVRRQLARIK